MQCPVHNSLSHLSGNTYASSPSKQLPIAYHYQLAVLIQSMARVECEGGTVHIDFEDGRAKKVTAQGEFIYMGDLEDRNEGLGYIPVS